MTREAYKIGTSLIVRYKNINKLTAISKEYKQTLKALNIGLL